MKSIFAATVFLLISATLQAQYYYKDILAAQETSRLMKLYKTHKVQSITATGFDGDGARSSEFTESQFILGNRIRFSSRNNTTVTNQYFNFNDQSLLTGIMDTSSSMISTTTYRYNDKNNVTAIQNVVNDDADSIYANEQHLWFYNNDNRPEKMFRVVNSKDTTEFRFMLDENGNVIEEQVFKKGRGGEKIYYYYDDKNRLTDIVRFHSKAQRLLPDYMFEYSADDKLIQKVTTLSDRGLSYLYWRYAYDDKGLKTKEITYNRDKNMTGKIEYSYMFGK